MEIKWAAKNSKEYQITAGWAKIITKYAKAIIELLYKNVDNKYNLCKNTIRVSYSNPIIKCGYYENSLNWKSVDYTCQAQQENENIR